MWPDVLFVFFFFQAEDGIRDLVRSRGLGDVYKRQVMFQPRVSRAAFARRSPGTWPTKPGGARSWTAVIATESRVYSAGAAAKRSPEASFADSVGAAPLNSCLL